MSSPKPIPVGCPIRFPVQCSLARPHKRMAEVANRARAFVRWCLCDWDALPWLAAPLLLGEALLCAFIVVRVPYTKYPAA